MSPCNGVTFAVLRYSNIVFCVAFVGFVNWKLLLYNGDDVSEL